MFFDLHCHPSFKTFLGNRQQSLRKDCWTNLNFDIDMNILDSQASLAQIKAGKAKLVVCALYALENAFAGSWKIKAAAGFSPHIEKMFLKEIRRQEWGYRELMLDEHQHLMLSKDISSQKSFVVLDSINDFDPSTDKLQLILAAEGGHNFYHNVQKPGVQSEVLENLRFHKQPGNPRLLYVTLTHLQQSGFCTHAFGMKLIKNQVFNPVGKSLNPLGRAFIREALSTQHGRRILVDVKHMSLKSRLSFYQLRKNEFPDAPIVATHMGVTGVSYLKKPVHKLQSNIKKKCVEVFYYRNAGAIDTYFNPWSINLYNEDIKEIMKSGGLIGLSLDQRILGWGNVSKEHFSEEEFVQTEFQPVKRPNYHPHVNPNQLPAKKLNDWQVRYLCNNWLHVIKVGKQEIGDDAWNHVCIGSDFDGLIDPVNEFKSAADYKFLFGRVVEWLPLMAEAMDIPLSAQEVQDKVRGLVFDNALGFLQEHYT